MRTVTAREANQGFSKLLAAVEAGEEVLITKRGHVVAKLTSPAEATSDASREAALARLLAHLERGLPLGVRSFSRAEIYDERDAELAARRARRRNRG
jgi:prevent-host-death family protein